MIDVQFLMGGGVLNPIVEHVGDLTHRVTHLVKYTPSDRLPSSSELGYWMVDEKVHKCLRMLQHGYGFNREFEQNIENNFPYKAEKIPSLTIGKYRQKLYDLLEKYSEAHAKLEVYNEVQWYCREAAIQVGKREWSSVEKCLKWLKRLVDDEDRYTREAAMFSLNRSGNIIPYNK